MATQTSIKKKTPAKKIPFKTVSIDSLRDEETLVVWKLDRLGRSVKHLVDFVGELQKQGVQFKS